MATQKDCARDLTFFWHLYKLARRTQAIRRSKGFVEAHRAKVINWLRFGAAGMNDVRC